MLTFYKRSLYLTTHKTLNTLNEYINQRVSVYHSKPEQKYLIQFLICRMLNNIITSFLFEIDLIFFSLNFIVNVNIMQDLKR